MSRRPRSVRTRCVPVGAATHPVRRAVLAWAAVVLVAAVPVVTTGQPAAPAAVADAARGPPTRPAGAFPTPDAAVEAFVAAARAGDPAALRSVLGPDGDDVVDSGDPVADKASRDRFVDAYDARHELVRGPVDAPPPADAAPATAPAASAVATPAADAPAGPVTLLIGPDRWPMPIPLVPADAGWRFDTAAGRDEIVNRRVGRNELDAMKVLAAIGDAQQDYVRLDPDHDGLPAYADRFASSPGRHDGLYWPTKPGEADSPLGPLIDQAAAEGYADPATQPTTAPAVSPRTPYHGYYYRMLLRQGPAAEGGAVDYRVDGRLVGGYGVVAWPADYGSSGVMTFVVNHRGVVYQQDLGPDTAARVKTVTAFDPTPDWTRCDSPGPTTRP